MRKITFQFFLKQNCFKYSVDLTSIFDHTSTLYLKDMHFKTFANRADPDQAAIIRAAWSVSTIFAYGNMIRYDHTLVDLTSNFFVLSTNVKVYLWYELKIRGAKHEYSWRKELDIKISNMRYPTMWYVRPAKPQISLCIRPVWSEPLLVAWIFYDC